MPGTKPQNTLRDEVELDGDAIPLILSNPGLQTQGVTHGCDKKSCPFGKLNESRSTSSPDGMPEVSSAVKQLTQGKRDIYCSNQEVKCPIFLKMFPELYFTSENFPYFDCLKRNKL